MMGGGKYGIAGDVLAPIVKSHAPWVGAWMRAKGSESVQLGFPRKPTAVLLSNGAIGSFHLGVMKDGLSENQITIRCPGKVVKGMVESSHPKPVRGISLRSALPSPFVSMRKVMCGSSEA